MRDNALILVNTLEFLIEDKLNDREQLIIERLRAQIIKKDTLLAKAASEFDEIVFNESIFGKLPYLEKLRDEINKDLYDFLEDKDVRKES